MNLTLLYTWEAEIKRRLPSLGAWQVAGLALLSFGIVVARHSSLGRIAEELSGVVSLCAPSVEKRLKRWVQNERLNLRQCSEEWVQWVASQYDVQRPVLLVDETKLGDWLGIMVVSWAYEGRAIPLMWYCYPANDAAGYPQQGQVLLIWQLVARVQQALPADCRPLVQVDRGLGNSGALMRAMQNLGVHFLFRVKQSSTLRTRRGHTLALSALAQPGAAITCRGALFTHRQSVFCTVHLYWEPGCPQPWCLATNDPSITGGLYARRVWQEESFRDLKSGGWYWHASQVHDPRRAERLLLALALAYAWMLTLGTLVCYSPSRWHEFTAGAWDKYSLFRLGLRFFKAYAFQQPTVVWAGLFFAPP